MNTPSSADALAELLGTAYRNNSTAALPMALEPADIESAYEVQLRLLEKCGLGIGGWKIGAKSATGPIQGAPLPMPRIYAAAYAAAHSTAYPSPAAIARRDYPVLGIELEIFFSFGRDFLPGAGTVTEQAVLNSISVFGTSIEIVSSRIAGWPDAPKLSQLADLQNHGALVTGKTMAYRSDFSFLQPQADLRIDGAPLFTGTGRNPAGDPRRLLCWLVNHCSERGLALPAGSIITTGTYTGIAFPTHAGTVTGEIAGLPAVTFELI